MVEKLDAVSKFLFDLEQLNWSFAEIMAVLAMFLACLAMLVLLRKKR